MVAVISPMIRGDLSIMASFMVDGYSFVEPLLAYLVNKYTKIRTWFSL
jgi:hypothetical protein